MANFFKDGFSKLQEAIAGATKPAENQQPYYQGRLSPGHFRVSEGSPLGLGAVVPQTLSFDPCANIIGICTPEGHARLFGQDFEVSLQNPLAPLQPEFLLFPRPGLLLCIGIATAIPGSRGSSSWIAQWWDLRSGGPRVGSKDKAPGGIQTPQVLKLRFSIVCAVASEANTSLVFLGTDEGDVRVFDAGEQPCMSGYCIPWDKLAVEKHRRADGHPCPVMALASAPNDAAELLVGGAEGGVVLWSFDKSKALRTFVAQGTVNSIVWHTDGNAFLVASRTEITIFSKSASASLARVPLPGGPASSVSLLRWYDGSSGTTEAIRGELLLRRGAPGPALLHIWGLNWGQTDNLFAGSECIAAAVLVPAGHSNSGTSSDSMASLFSTASSPCGCMALPWSVQQKSSAQRSAAYQRLAKTPLVLAALGDPGTRLVVRTLPPMRPIAWPASWGSLELVGHSALELIPKDQADLPWPDRSQSREENLSPSAATEIEAVASGTLMAECGAMPSGCELESVDGWLLCHGDENSPANGQGICWQLPEQLPPGIIDCRVSLGDCAQSVLVLSSDSGTDMITFDVLSGSASCQGCSGSGQHNLDITPGEESIVKISNEDGKLTLSWCDTVLLGPVTMDGSLKRIIWRASLGQLRIKSMAYSEVLRKADVPKQNSTAQMAEVMFARRFAHFEGYVAGGEVDLETWQFVESWSSMVGGWQGLLCSGHRDGTVRIWLRAHSATLLLHTVSIRPLPALSWRPQFDIAAKTPQFKPIARGVVRWYDGVDACPAVSSEDDESCQGDACSSCISAVVFQPAVGMLAAGTSGGNVVLFTWSDTPVPLSLSEYAELELRSMDFQASEEAAASAPEEALGPDDAGASADGHEEVTAESAEAKPEAEQDCSDDKQSPVGELPLLPAGFTCTVRLRQHQEAVTKLAIVPTSGGAVHLVSTDGTSRLCIVDAISGSVLFSGALDQARLDASTPSLPSTGAGSAIPAPPPETIEGFVLADRVLRAASTTPEVHASSQSGEFIDAQQSGLQCGVATSSTYIVMLSSGEMRQLATPDMSVMDSRIRETRLPQVRGGAVLLMHLSDNALVIVQSGAAHVLVRSGDCELASPQSVRVSPQILSAEIGVVDRESCLYLFLSDVTVRILSLPGLQKIASVSLQDSVQHVLSLGARAPVAYVGCDGYIVLQGASAEGNRLWWASTLSDACALDEAARLVPAALIAQATQPKSVEAPAPKAGANQSGSRVGGVLSNLFGGTSAPRPLRECVVPQGQTALPSEVDASKVDRGRGLPPAWSDPTARPPPPPPPPPPPTQAGASSSTARTRLGLERQGPGAASGSNATRAAASGSALSGAKAELAQANARALERGEKLSEIANKSKQLSDDTADFLKMAKQLNKKQNSWF